MAGKTLDLMNIISPDRLAIEISNKYIEWNGLRQNKVRDWEELRKYIYATDTTQTTNAKLPWKNKTTIPKLTQIRDNLFSNYMASIFPRRKWLSWNANNKQSDSKDKRDAILNYMSWVVSQPSYKEEMAKIILDYIDYGNCFGTVEWTDQRVEMSDKTQVGYVGPSLRRISPVDIVFNPIAASFIETPKIIRSFMTLGELKKKLEQLSSDENQKEYEDLFKYLIDYRTQVSKSGASDLEVKDGFLRMDGFDSFRSYLESDYVEILTFYGDLYDRENDQLLKNHVIMVVDKHKLISKKPNPSFFGYPPIFHCGWRPRQDNLWAMGPLDNLVGMQYRIDHEENLKADVFDQIAAPVLKIKGYVQDFTWGPWQRIYTSEEGDVEMMAPPFQILQTNASIDSYANTMEAMAGSPKEAMGFRTPGEKTKYEVQRLENAASRIFQNKITQFEEQFVERTLNAKLELARRNISGVQEINVFDDDFKIQTFLQLTSDDITGAGLIKPIGARHFAEKAEIVQNITSFYSSAAAQDPMVLQHFSSIKIAKMFEDLLELQDFELVQENIRISEQVNSQRLAAAGEEQLQMGISTPSGLTEDDADRPFITEGLA